MVFRWSLAGWFRFCPCVLGGLPTLRPPGRGPSPPPSSCLVGPSPTRGRYGCPYCPSASRRRRRRPLLAGSGWHVVRARVAPDGVFLPCAGGHLPVPPLITRLRPSLRTCAIHVRGLLCFPEWFLGRSGSSPLGGRRPSWCVPHTVGLASRRPSLGTVRCSPPSVFLLVSPSVGWSSRLPVLVQRIDSRLRLWLAPAPRSHGPKMGKS